MLCRPRLLWHGSRRWLSSVINRGSGRKRVVVAMSGGVDSSVAALLLKNQGYDCIGVFMKNWDSSDEIGREACPIEVDRADMREVCRRLDIPAYDVDFVKEYWNEVFVPFIEAYQSGRETPNPDVLCNRHIKFKYFLEYARRQFHADFIATGHYAQLQHPTANDESLRDGMPPALPKLLRAADPSKDQSYFLCMTPGDKLSNILFPVGALTKTRVKAIAAAHFAGQSVVRKRESVGLCFVGERDMPAFLSGYFTPTPGRFVDIDTGLPVGEPHKGRELYTNGQKARISGAPHKYYCVAHLGSTLRPVSAAVSGYTLSPGDVYVACGKRHPALYSDYAVLDGASMSWVAGGMPAELQAEFLSAQQQFLLDGSRNNDTSSSSSGRSNIPNELITGADVTEPSPAYPYTVQQGHLEAPVPCAISFLFRAPAAAPDAQPRFDVLVRMARPEWALCPGQVSAIYRGRECLGGGKVKSFGTAGASA